MIGVSLSPKRYNIEKPQKSILKIYDQWMANPNTTLKDS